MTQEKAKYRILRQSFIGNRLLNEGDEVDYEGEPGSALEPLNDAARKAKGKVEGKSEPINPSAEGGDDSGLEVNPDLAGSSQLNNDDDNGDEGGPPESGTEIDQLRDDYEALFNKKAHPAMKADTLRDKIAEERERLGN